MARAREVPGFDCDEAFGAAAARVLRVRADEVVAHAEGVLDDDGVDAVHDMRVAARRLRSALEMFEPCLPRKRLGKALRMTRLLGEALGERRDADVRIEQLRGFAEVLGGADGAAIEALVEAERRRRADAGEALVAAVEPRRLEKLLRRVGGLADAAEERAAGGGRGKRRRLAREPVRGVAAEALRGRLRRLRRRASPALEPGAGRAQHRLRLAAKRLRYGLEIAEPCFGPPAKAARRSARGLQALLGDLHDCDELLPLAAGVPGLEAALRARRELLYRGLLELWAETAESWDGLQRALR